jgi:hypothetical protein
MHRFVIAACLTLVFGALGASCNCGSNGTDTDGGSGGGSGGGTGGGSGGGSGGGTGGGSGGGTGGGTSGCVPGLSGLAIAPADSTVTIAAQPAEIVFTATGLVAGVSTDVTSRLTWTAKRDDDTPPGTFSSAGHYQPTPGAGGRVTLTATDGCATATTTVTLRLETVLNDPGSTTTGRFNGTVVSNDPKSPDVVYPSDQTRFPRNIYKVLFQWERGGNDTFRLTFDGPYSKTVVYTDGRNATCPTSTTTTACWEADITAWLAIAGSNAGETVTLTIDGVTMNDARVFRGASITLGFSRRDVTGAIFYWSTTSAGVRRASVSDAQPEEYVVGKPVGTVLPNDGGIVKCVACHTVSRSGKRMYAYTEATAKGGYVYEVTLRPPPRQIVTSQITTRRTFGTFRPDDQRVVATVDALLAEYEADTGTKVTNLPVTAGTNPDWSPTGLELAYSDKGGDSPGGANLSLIPYASGTWGTPRVLVPAGGLTNLFPSFSPDGHHVAYARGKGGHGDKTLQLFIASVDGGTPIELVTANRIVNSQMTAGQHENNMPTWAPPGDYDWIAFNSVRPYGVVYPTGGTQQIWVAAIDRNKLAQGLDPSFPAFRFAFQGLGENNHRAYWTLDVRDTPDAGRCAPLGAACSANAPCCAGTNCLSNVEFGNICQVPVPDAGACLPDGMACDQTSGPTCCGLSVCDVTVDGGYACHNPIQ